MEADLDIATAALRRAKAMKEDLVKRDGVGEDLAPTLDLWVDGTPWMSVYLSGDGVDQAPIINVAVGFSSCDLALLITEGYLCIPDDPLEAEDMPRGELGRRFAAGDPTVRETVMVGMMPKEGPCRTWTVAYTYQGRSVAWGEERLSDESKGRLAEAARDGYANRIDEPMEFLELAHGLVELPHVEAVGCFVEKTPPRNAPCPCGSGRKAKHCECRN